MESFYSDDSKLSNKPGRMRAMIEIVDGQMRVFPIASSDEDEQRIRDAVRILTRVSGEQ